MIYYLRRSHTGFRATTALLSKFIRITVETGLTCATFAILDLSLFLAFQQNNYHLAPSIALSKIYANSLLVVSVASQPSPVPYHSKGQIQVLNVRVQIMGGRNGDSRTAITIGSSTVDNFSARYPNEASHKMNAPISVTISESQITAADNIELGIVPPGDVSLLHMLQAR